MTYDPIRLVIKNGRVLSVVVLRIGEENDTEIRITGGN
jgi:hypothetical protein